MRGAAHCAICRVRRAHGVAGAVGDRQRHQREQLAPVAPGVQARRTGPGRGSAHQLGAGARRASSRTRVERVADAARGAARCGRARSAARRRSPAAPSPRGRRRRPARRAFCHGWPTGIQRTSSSCSCSSAALRERDGARRAPGRSCRRTGRRSRQSARSGRDPVARAQEVGVERASGVPAPGCPVVAPGRRPAASTSGCSRCGRPTAGRTACRDRRRG